MKRTRRVFGGEFRAKVALAAVKGDTVGAGQPLQGACDAGIGLAQGADGPRGRAV